MSYADAVDYVRTDTISGAAQSSIALSGGAPPDQPFLEIGCGTLHLAQFMVPWLEPGMYHGIDPNVWLREAAFAERPTLAELCIERGAQFSDADDFLWPDASTRFAVIFSHSVLSHASRGQLVDYMLAVGEQLQADGVAIASLNLDRRTTATHYWTYPAGVTFTMSDVWYAARLAGLAVEEQPEWREHVMRVRPDECHNWIRLVHE